MLSAGERSLSPVETSVKSCTGLTISNRNRESIIAQELEVYERIKAKIINSEEKKSEDEQY